MYKKQLDLGMASLILIAAFCTQFFFQLVVYLFKLPSGVYTWIVVVANQLILLGVCLAFAFTQKFDFVDVLGLKRPPKWYLFPIFIFVAFACLFAFAPLSGLFKRMLEKLGYDFTVNYHISMNNTGLFVLSFFALTLLPVVGEETALRGVLFSGSRKVSPVFAIVYSALIFALMHGNMTQLIHQFLLGLVMGYLVCVTHSIYASAVIHSANNGLALLFENGMQNGWIDPRFYWYLNGELGIKTLLIGMGTAFFALVVLLVFVTLLLHRDRAKSSDDLSVPVGISVYLDYLAGLPLEEEKADAEEGKYFGEDSVTFKYRRREVPDKFSILMAVALAVMLAMLVLATLIPGGS